MGKGPKLIRHHAVDLEVRGGDGRTVEGIACPFDEVAEIRELSGTYNEVVRFGAFARTIAERADKVRFLASHNHQTFPLGKPTELREDTAGLWMSARISKTTAGDEALELIKDGALDGLSIGFRPIQNRWHDGETWDAPRLCERLEVALMEVSAVAVPAFDGARLLALRSAEHNHYFDADAPRVLSAELARRRLQLLERTTR